MGTVCLLTGVPCIRLTLYFEYLCLFWDTLFPRWGNFSPIYLTINSRQIQGICHNLYVIMVINLFVLLYLKFSVTRARIECCVFSILNYININIDCTTGNIGNCQMFLSLEIVKCFSVNQNQLFSRMYNIYVYW